MSEVSEAKWVMEVSVVWCLKLRSNLRRAGKHWQGGGVIVIRDRGRVTGLGRRQVIILTGVRAKKSHIKSKITVRVQNRVRYRSRQNTDPEKRFPGVRESRSDNPISKFQYPKSKCREIGINDTFDTEAPKLVSLY